MTNQIQEDVLVLEQEQTQQLPPMYKVVLLNDDFTPMDFVVEILQRHFSKNFEEATEIMLKVHNEGRGICGVFSREIAETKVDLVTSQARCEGHPLRCVMEEV